MSDEQPDSATASSVSVIIPTYNDAAGLARCLRCVLDQDYPADRVEIIVVDNASSQDLRTALPADSRFQLIYEPRRGSYAARNAGVAHATGEILVFTDADCLPRPDWLSAGVRTLLGPRRPDAVGGAISLVLGKARSMSGAELYDAIEGFPQEHFVAHYPFAATANVFVRADTFAAVGPFDVALASGGDREWGMRLAKSGRTWTYAPDAVVEHPSRATWKELTRKSARVARGVSDLSHEPWRNTLVGVSREARGAFTVWFDSELLSNELLEKRRDRARYAAAYAYVRLLRAGVRLGGLVSREWRMKRTAGETHSELT